MAAVDTARAARSVVGLLVSDAACLGLHWIYDTEQLDARLTENKAPHGLFHTPQANMYYGPDKTPDYYNPGQQSPYGDHALATLRSLHKAPADKAREALGKGMTEFVRTYGGRLNTGPREFKDQLDAGKEWNEAGGGDKQADVLHVASVVTALYAGNSNVLQLVEDTVRVVNNNDTAVEAAKTVAIILNAVLTGSDLSAALEVAEKNAPASMVPHLLSAKEAAAEGQELRPFLVSLGPKFIPKGSEKYNETWTPRMGLTCDLPYSLLGSAFLLYTAARSDLKGAYVTAIKANAVAGGDNCGRTGGFAAVLAAVDEPPQDLVDKTKEAKGVAALFAERA